MMQHISGKSGGYTNRDEYPEPEKEIFLRGPSSHFLNPGNKHFVKGARDKEKL